MRHRLQLILSLLLTTSTLMAQPRLLVLAPEEQPPRPSLVEALRLQLRGTADVELSGRALPLGSAGARIAGATEIVAGEHVEFAIWLESLALGSGQRLFVLYVVGGKPGRAVVEVVRLPAESDGPDVDRTLALKASEIVEAALAPPLILIASPTPTMAPAQPAAPRAMPLAAPAVRAVHAWGVELSGTVRSIRNFDSPALGLGLGMSWLLLQRPLELDTRISAMLGNEERIVIDEARRILLTDSDVQLGVCLRSIGTVQLGLRLDFALHMLSVDGYLGVERTGGAFLLSPGIASGPELRIALGSRLRLATNAAAEWMAFKQGFVVASGAPVNLSRVRGIAELSLIFFPL